MERSTAPPRRRHILLVFGGVILIEWPPEIFSEGILIYGWNPVLGPQLTLPLAVITAWVMKPWLPTVLAAAPRRKDS